MRRTLVLIAFASFGCRQSSFQYSGADAGDLPARALAVQKTIETNPACTKLPTFYWEVGDVNGALASGSVGGATVDGRMAIASATKLIWGAYVVERFKADLSKIDLTAMTLRSGYTNLTYGSCLGKATVQDCFAAGDNGVHSPEHDGRFDYNGGHFQKYAVDLGLGGDDNGKLAADFKALLGEELDFSFGSPQLAAGAETSAAGYAVFLRKILAGQLAIHDHLGEAATCTEPKTCPTADYSPASPYAWHYSYAHWVEDDPQTGDGTFSSTGAFGFYPWIDASKRYYGILARHSILPAAAAESATCGRFIRTAFMSGQPQ